MADSNITPYENSVQEGEPVECYKFIHNNVSYMYTSAATDHNLLITDEQGNMNTETYFADVIERAAITPSSQGQLTSCEIVVKKNHNIGMLFQGTPPEQPVKVIVYRTHGSDNAKFDTIFNGEVSQVSFSGSECTLSVTMENYLKKELPNGMLQYYCNNVVFDKECRLKREDWEVNIMVDLVEGGKVFSKDLENFEEDYFQGGILKYDIYTRTILENTKEYLVMKYPMPASPRNIIKIYPGCDHTFKACCQKFDNHVNFTGCPYMPPTDSEKNPVGKGMYWIDDLVIQRDTDGFVGTIDV